MEISKMFGLAEKYFVEIICALLCLGYKKESGLHNSFVDCIKEFILDERIQNSKYSPLLQNIDYQNIDKEFLSNLNSLLNLILKNEDEEKIYSLIKKLKKTEEYKEQRISSVSTNIEINEEENKSERSKNAEERISTEIQQESSVKCINSSNIIQNQPPSSPKNLIQFPDMKNSEKSGLKPSSLTDEINLGLKEEKDKSSGKETFWIKGRNKS